MGCSGAREKIEDKIMLLKLERTEIQMEKEKELNKLSELEGHTIKPNQIPDYIDHNFAKIKIIYNDDDEFCFPDKKTGFTSNNQNKKRKGKGKRKRKRKSKNKQKLKKRMIKENIEKDK